MLTRCLCPHGWLGWLRATKPCGLRSFPLGEMDLNWSSHSLPPSPRCDQRHVFVRELAVFRAEIDDEETESQKGKWPAEPWTPSLWPSTSYSDRLSKQTLACSLRKRTRRGPLAPWQPWPERPDIATQFSSVAQSCPILCSPMDCSVPGFLVHYKLPEIAQLMSIQLAMPSNHLILCRPLFLPPSIFASIRVFSNESVLHIRWPKYWSFSFSISPSSEYSGLISFRMDWLDLLAVEGILKSPLQHHSAKASILQSSATQRQPKTKIQGNQNHSSSEQETPAFLCNSIQNITCIKMHLKHSFQKFNLLL